MEHQPVWRDVAHALGQLQMWLLAPVMPTASQSTRKPTRFSIAIDGTCLDLRCISTPGSRVTAA